MAGMKQAPLAWGRLPAPEQRQLRLTSRYDPLPAGSDRLLAHGLGRSYGDSCLNSGGLLIETRGLDRFIAFDVATGVIEVEAGVSLGEIIAFAVMMLSNDHPEAAIAVFNETSDLKEMEGMGDHIIPAALRKWAEKDPMAALEWIRKNAEEQAGVVTDDTKAATLNYKLATGETRMNGLHELRVKESDRLQAVAAGLKIGRAHV